MIGHDTISLGEVFSLSVLSCRSRIVPLRYLFENLPRMSNWPSLPVYTPLHQIPVNYVQACFFCFLISSQSTLFCILTIDYYWLFKSFRADNVMSQWWPRCWPERQERCPPSRSAIVSPLTVESSRHILVWKFIRDQPSSRKVGGESLRRTPYLLPY